MPSSHSRSCSSRPVPGPGRRVSISPSNVPFLVIDEIDVIEAVSRTATSEQAADSPSIAVLLCTAAQELLAVVSVRSIPAFGAPPLIAQRLLEVAMDGADICFVWMAYLRPAGDLLTFCVECQLEHNDAREILAEAGIELGPAVVMGPHGWFLPGE
jgi:hypothetical protein